MPRSCLSIVSVARVVALLACSCEAPSPDPVPDHETFTLDSAVLGETRTISVWLPPAYADFTAALPVLHMPDGGIAEDFPHIANTIAELVAAAFRSFIADELIPEIEGRYRVRPDRRALLGESVAGSFDVETLFLRPDLFRVYLAMDPSLWWNDYELVKRAAERLRGWSVPGVRFWFAASNAADIARHCAAPAASLEAAKANGLERRFEPRPAEQHSTIFRATKAAMFAWGLWRE
jgi:predicted alpha/beta superfamily hydrolase